MVDSCDLQDAVSSETLKRMENPGQGWGDAEINT